jgi:hypothetical protein
LELRTRIEVAAILARVQVGFAFWTLAVVVNIDRRRNDCAAQRATQHFLKPRHLHRTGCFARFRTARAALRFFARLVMLPFTTLAIVVLVSALAVFSFHNRFLEEIPEFKREYGSPYKKVTAELQEGKFRGRLPNFPLRSGL